MLYPDSMNVIQIKTKKFTPPKDDIDVLLGYIPKLSEKTIVAISSKVISICEGNTIPQSTISHNELVSKLAEKTLEPVRRGKNDMILTQIGNVLVESAGVDVSNANGHYVLLPKDPYKSAHAIWKNLRKRDKISHLGVIIIDSHSVPRRKGAMSFALSAYGFRATNDYENQRDIFGHAFKFTAANVADSIAAAAGLVMGEGNEVTPVALVSDISNVKFFRRAIPLRTARRYSWVHPDLDVYAPLLKSNIWQTVKK